MQWRVRALCEPLRVASRELMVESSRRSSPLRTKPSAVGEKALPCECPGGGRALKWYRLTLDANGSERRRPSKVWPTGPARPRLDLQHTQCTRLSEKSARNAGRSGSVVGERALCEPGCVARDIHAQLDALREALVGREAGAYDLRVRGHRLEHEHAAPEGARVERVPA